jgi:hypothetical protein
MHWFMGSLPQICTGLGLVLDPSFGSVRERVPVPDTTIFKKSILNKKIVISGSVRPYSVGNFRDFSFVRSEELSTETNLFA